MLRAQGASVANRRLAAAKVRLICTYLIRAGQGRSDKLGAALCKQLFTMKNPS